MATLVEFEKDFEFFVKSILAGGVAGMCSKTTVAPLDRIKILLQAHNEHYKHFGVFSGLREIIQKETVFALYKGNWAQMVRIFPYAATQYTAFEFYKKHLGSVFGKHSHIDKFVAGSAAGVTAVAITYPLDTIRARLAFQVTGSHLYSGIVHTAASIFKDMNLELSFNLSKIKVAIIVVYIAELMITILMHIPRNRTRLFIEGGFKALYRGFLPTVFGMIPYAGFSFYCFEQFKYLCMMYAPNYLCSHCDRNTGGLVLTLPAKLLCGGIAGAVAQSFSYPLDVTRRRMQLAMMNPATHKYGFGMLSTVKMIYSENGVMKGLYRGMSINYIRAIPMVAVSFATYELMKQTLDLDTGMKLS